MLQRIGPRSLVIVPGDRTDVIRAIVGAHDDGEPDGDGAARARADRRLPAEPSASSTRSAQADLFATLVPEDTYEVASEIHDLLVKTHPSDAGKIAEIKALVWEYLFIDRVLEVAAEDSPPRLGGVGRRAAPTVREIRDVFREPSSATATIAVPTRQPTAQSRNRPGMSERPAMAPPRTEPMIVASPAARRRTGPARYPAGPRRPRREHGHAADEDAGEPDALERGDEDERDRVGGERRQERPERERQRTDDEQPLRAEPRVRAAGTRTSAGPRCSAPNAQAMPTSAVPRRARRSGSSRTR